MAKQGVVSYVVCRDRKDLPRDYLLAVPAYGTAPVFIRSKFKCQHFLSMKSASRVASALTDPSDSDTLGVSKFDPNSYGFIQRRKRCCY